MSGEYPVRGWVVHEVSNINLIDSDFRGGNTFSFAGPAPLNWGKKSNVGGANPAGQIAFETGATIEQLINLHNQSGSSMPFLQWVQQDEVKQQIKNLVKTGSLIANGTTGTETMLPPEDANKPAAEIKIAGMHPLTFGLVAIGSAAVLFFAIPALVKHIKTVKNK